MYNFDIDTLRIIYNEPDFSDADIRFSFLLTLWKRGELDQNTSDIILDSNLLRALKLSKDALVTEMKERNIDHTKISYIDAVLVVLSQSNPIAVRLIAQSLSGDEAIIEIAQSLSLSDKNVLINQLKVMLKFNIIKAILKE